MKLSIIVPVYNVESFIGECFESIYSQITPECELIFVDDGSEDKSGSMVDAYAELSNQIVVIHKKNGGLASARNAGLEIALGEYVAFVDSDDRLSAGCLHSVMDWIDQGGSDICFMQAIKFFPNGYSCDLGDCIDDSIRFKSKLDALAYLATRPKFSGSSCTKIFRRSFLKDNGLWFPSDNRQSEDLGFVRDCILRAKDYDSLDVPYYEYRQNRTGSITDNVSMRGVDGLLFFIEETIELYSDQEVSNPIKHCALSFAAYEYGVMLFNFGLLSNNRSRLSRLFRIKKCRWVLRFAQTKKLKLLNCLTKVFGVAIASKMLVLIYMFMMKFKKSKERGSKWQYIG